MECDVPLPDYPWCLPFLARLAVAGNVTDACDAAGISRRRVYQVRDTSSAFAALWQEAQERALDRLEGEAYRRAVEGSLRPIFFKGEVCGHVREYSDRMAELLLRGLRPDKYGQHATTPSARIHVHIHSDGKGVQPGITIDVDGGPESDGADSGDANGAAMTRGVPTPGALGSPAQALECEST